MSLRPCTHLESSQPLPLFSPPLEVFGPSRRSLIQAEGFIKGRAVFREGLFDRSSLFLLRQTCRSTDNPGFIGGDGEREKRSGGGMKLKKIENVPVCTGGSACNSFCWGKNSLQSPGHIWCKCLKSSLPGKGGHFAPIQVCSKQNGPSVNKVLGWLPHWVKYVRWGVRRKDCGGSRLRFMAPMRSASH